MINNIFSEFGNLFGLDEGIFTDDSNFMEITENENFDNVEYISETDEIRINETAEIMTEIFNKDVLTTWNELSLDEKASKLNEYYLRAGKNLNIETKGVIIEQMYSNNPNSVTLGYNSGDGYIHINVDMLNDPSKLGDILDTATHEMRHQFQTDVLKNPHNFNDIPQDIIDRWRYEWTPGNYIRPEYDPQGYYEQKIECDARDFAEAVIKTYTDKMNLN